MNFGLNPVNGGGLSLMRILGSISRTLGMVRQVAPIYREVKPLVMKVPAFFSRLGEMRNGVRDTQKRLSSYIDDPNYTADNYPNTITESAYSNGGPTFFQ